MAMLVANDPLLNLVLEKEHFAFQAYSILVQNVPLSTRSSIVGNQVWLQ